MTDRPVIFSAPMVQALLREARAPGTGKTMTRRLLYSERDDDHGFKRAAVVKGRAKNGVEFIYHPCESVLDYPITHYFVPSGWQRCAVGDRLWVRENLRLISVGPGRTIGLNYAADGEMGEVHFHKPEKHKLKRVGITPSIHMPRWASRITLTVKAVKIERLKAISHTDAKAEGMHEFKLPNGSCWGYDPKGTPGRDVGGDPRSAFARLWMRLHGEDSWQANPWVVAISFDVAERNIDNPATTVAA